MLCSWLDSTIFSSGRVSHFASHCVFFKKKCRSGLEFLQEQKVRDYLDVVLISIPLVKKRVSFHMFMCFMFLHYLYIDFSELSDYAFCSVFNQVCGLSLFFKRILYIRNIIATYIRIYSIRDIYLSIIYFIHIILILHGFSFTVCFLLCLH